MRLGAVGASAWPSFATSGGGAGRGPARRASAFARTAARPSRPSRPDSHQLLKQLVPLVRLGGRELHDKLLFRDLVVAVDLRGLDVVDAPLGVEDNLLRLRQDHVPEHLVGAAVGRVPKQILPDGVGEDCQKIALLLAVAHRVASGLRVAANGVIEVRDALFDAENVFDHTVLRVLHLSA